MKGQQPSLDIADVVKQTSRLVRGRIGTLLKVTIGVYLFLLFETGVMHFIEWMAQPFLVTPVLFLTFLFQAAGISFLAVHWLRRSAAPLEAPTMPVFHRSRRSLALPLFAVALVFGLAQIFFTIILSSVIKAVSGNVQFPVMMMSHFTIQAVFAVIAILLATWFGPAFAGRVMGDESMFSLAVARARGQRTKIFAAFIAVTFIAMWLFAVPLVVFGLAASYIPWNNSAVAVIESLVNLAIVMSFFLWFTACAVIQNKLTT